MPTAAQTHCATPGCPELVQGGYCSEHKGKRERAYDQHRGSRHERGYDHVWYEWLARYRAGYDLDATTQAGVDQLLARNRCASCWASGIRTTHGLEFDHITPLSAGGRRLDPANVQPLCGACHRRKTAGERRQAGWGSPKSFSQNARNPRRAKFL